MACKTYQVFAENPAHPSLRYKKLAGHDGIWSARINDSFRALAERKGDVISGEFAAIVEFDAFAQLEFPGQWVDRSPGGGNAGNDPRLFINARQRVEHVPPDCNVVLGGNVMRVLRAVWK